MTSVWRTTHFGFTSSTSISQKDADQHHLARVHVVGGTQPGTVVLSDLVYERLTSVFFYGLLCFCRYKSENVCIVICCYLSREGGKEADIQISSAKT